MTSNFYKAKEIYGETFYQLPKVLFTNSKYINLSNDAKVAYALLKDRFNYSIRNNWIDEEDNIYFIFTNSELMNLLLCGNKKTVRIKKELEQVGLLFQKRMGLNKPNRLYLLRPEVEATDVYQQISPQTLGTSGSVKMTHNQYKEQLDTNKDTKLDTQKLNFSTANFSSAEIEKQNRDLVTHAKDFLTDEDSGLPVFLEPEAVQLLSFWCRTPQQMRRFISIILNAKYKVQKDHQDLGVIIPLDDEELKPLMTKTLRRYFNALRSNEKHIKNVENYLYGTMQNLFGVWWNKQIAKEHAARHAKEEKKPTDNGLGYY